MADEADGCRVGCRPMPASWATELNPPNLQAERLAACRNLGDKAPVQFGPVALARCRLKRESVLPIIGRKVVSMFAKPKLVLDPTGRFVAEPRSSAAVQPPHRELRQLLAPLERICGN